MRTKGLWAILGFLAGLAALPLAASDRLEMKLRVFEGARQGTLSPPEFVTTSYIRPTVTASLEMQGRVGRRQGKGTDHAGLQPAGRATC